jgi:hypothetical protein
VRSSSFGCVSLSKDEECNESMTPYSRSCSIRLQVQPEVQVLNLDDGTLSKHVLGSSEVPGMIHRVWTKPRLSSIKMATLFISLENILII